MGVFDLMFSRRILLFFILTIAFKSSIAEVYKDFLPYTSVAQIKLNYINANIEVIKAGWVKENDLFLKITGPGLPGITYVATKKRTDDEVKEAIERYKRIIADGKSDSNDFWQRMIESNERYLNAPEDEKYTVNWVRWVPGVPFSIERLKSKFGDPTKFDFGEDDFQPYAEWSARRLSASLSDDKKMVFAVEYHFTDDDYNRALGLDVKTEESTESTPANNSKPKTKSSKSKKTSM